MPLDSAETIANALNERTSTSHGKKAAKAKKAPKTHPARRESTKTITTRLYRKWAEVVKDRAHSKCEVCGEPDSKAHPLNAHHIMPRQNFSGLRFDPMNGVALCPKCHKFGKFSAHKGGIWFGSWLSANRFDRYKHCMELVDKELDCKDRLALYRVEAMLADLLHTYRVRYVVGGNDFVSEVGADNPKAAEFLCQAAAGKRIKVVRTELVK